jgi:hypothetical protein
MNPDTSVKYVTKVTMKKVRFRSDEKVSHVCDWEASVSTRLVPSSPDVSDAAALP